MSANEVLRTRGTTFNAVVLLAQTVRDVGNRVALSIENVLWALDSEQRGGLSVGSRRDASAVEQTIRSLLEEPLLGTDDREQVWKNTKRFLEETPSPVDAELTKHFP